jgi:hypothetical protein
MLIEQKDIALSPYVLFLGVGSLYVAFLAFFIWVIYPPPDSSTTHELYTFATQQLSDRWGRNMLTYLYYFNLGFQLLQVCLWAVFLPLGWIEAHRYSRATQNGRY